jgi:hypothetical protein
MGPTGFTLVGPFFLRVLKLEVWNHAAGSEQQQLIKAQAFLAKK